MSKKSRRIPDRILDIKEALANIRNDIGELTKEEFILDGKTQRAIIESIIVIGEAANHIMRLDPGIEQRTPDVWQYFRDAYDMRIVLTHEYFRIDASVVWDTVKNDLPKLETTLSAAQLEKENLETVSTHHAQRGFTLVELAIVLVIVALLVGGMLVSFGAQREISTANEAQKRLAEIRETLLGYAEIYGRLPCPMLITTTDPADADYGIAKVPCTAGDEGILPWKTLGVLETDPWGTPRTTTADSFDGYWRYRVDTAFATTFSLTTPQASAFSVINNAGNTLTAAAEAPVAIVFSNGPNLVANGENGGTVNTIYQAGERTATFDDILIWIGRPLLFNRMIAAGKLPS